MNGEDKIFLLQVINAIRSGGNEMAKFLLDKSKIERTVRIKQELGQDKFDEVLTQLKEVIYEEEN
jgi:hypothetical protein